MHKSEFALGFFLEKNSGRHARNEELVHDDADEEKDVNGHGTVPVGVSVGRVGIPD